MNNIIFVDSSVQDYQSLIKDAKDAKIVILNDQFSASLKLLKPWQEPVILKPFISFLTGVQGLEN